MLRWPFYREYRTITSLHTTYALCFASEPLQYTGTALFSTGTADSVTTTSNTQANSSRDERSTARQTAEEANSILVDGVVVQPAYRSTPWEAEAKHAATATDKV